MNTETIPQASKEVHHGRNVKRFREMFGIKQDILADLIEASQQTVSRYEAQKELDEDTLNKIAKALNIPAEAIKKFDEESAVNFISNTFTLNEQSVVYQNNFNPVEKIMQLYGEKIELYERLLKPSKKKTRCSKKC